MYEDISYAVYRRIFSEKILSKIMTLCVLKRILRKKKSIFMQPLESPITPHTVAALRMIICKRPAPPDDHLKEAFPPDDNLQP